MTVLPNFDMSVVGSFRPKEYEKKALDLVMDKLHERAAANVPKEVIVQHVIGHGIADEEILRLDGEVGVDLIVMGSHRPYMEDYLLGPNAAHVVSHANCSVLMVREWPKRSGRR